MRISRESLIALIVAPPWLRTGTGRVIESQIAYYRDRGFATAFVGVPLNPYNVATAPLWAYQSDAAQELGADIATFAILDNPVNPKTLRRRIGHAFNRWTALDWIVDVGRCCRPPPALLSFLDNRAIAIFHVNHVFTMGFAQRLRQELGKSGYGPPLLLETHDVQSQILFDRKERNPWTGGLDDFDSLLHAEKALIKKADVLVHCSIDDLGFLVKEFPRTPQFLVLPHISDQFAKTVVHAQQIAPIDILLVGTGHHANSGAVEWFLTEVWPLIAARLYVLKIVGSVDDMFRHKRPDLYARFRECFLGPVADLAPYYRAARAVIAPMRSGGGISVKTIEAFALGMPFVGTSKAYRGIPKEPLKRHGIQSYDQPDTFAEALLRALSAEDDTGERGRQVYEELFSKESYYAARDKSIPLRLRNQEYPDPIISSALAEGSAGASPSKTTHDRDINLLVLGTSNCIGLTSFVKKTTNILGAPLTNLSVGGCSSTLGLYQIDKVNPVQRGIALIDFAINDNDAAWTLWGGDIGKSIIKDNLRTIISRLRSNNFFPLVILSPSRLADSSEPPVNALYRDFCASEQVNFIDLHALMLDAVGSGMEPSVLMRDDYHISCKTAEEVALFFASLVRRIHGTAGGSIRRSTPIVERRVIGATELFGPSALVSRHSSLRSAILGRLMPGEKIRIPLRQDERLRGVMINTGAPGGTVAFRSSNAEIVKSMTAYHDPRHRTRFESLLIDFAHPFLGGASGVTMEMLAPNAAATEHTVHGKPVSAECYGEVEIEGVLVTGRNNVQFDYDSPAYDWLPLDLQELKEAEVMIGRLCHGRKANC